MNSFFQKLSKNPTVLVRLLFSVVFFAIGATVLLVPSVTNGVPGDTKKAIGVFILVYGAYRFFTFFREYRKLNDDN